MDHDRYQKIRRVMEEALELRAEDRVFFLRGNCGRDRQLLEEVLDLLTYAPDETEGSSDSDTGPS